MSTSTAKTRFEISIPLYPNVDLLGIAAPRKMFSWISTYLHGARRRHPGISSGLDEALELVARITGYDVAVQIQAVTQYFPDPPIRDSIPAVQACPLDLHDGTTAQDTPINDATRRVVVPTAHRGGAVENRGSPRHDRTSPSTTG